MLLAVAVAGVAGEPPFPDADAVDDDWGGEGDAGEPIDGDSASFLGASRQQLQVVILEPADGEVLWTEDIGASFDIVVEIHGGSFNYWDRVARIDADAFIELDGEEIWHADGSINIAELTVWNSRVTIEVADDGTVVNRLREPHRVSARLVDGSEEVARVTNVFDIARSAVGQGWAKDAPYSAPWVSPGRAGSRSHFACTRARTHARTRARTHTHTHTHTHTRTHTHTQASA